MKIAFVPLFASLCVLNARGVDNAERKVTPDQARALVLASLTREQRQLPSLGLEQSNGYSSRFLFFEVTWAGTPNGSVVVDNFAVDPFTGDVFSATASCLEEKNKKLRELQKQVRATLHLTQMEYQKLKTNGPLCEE